MRAPATTHLDNPEWREDLAALKKQWEAGELSETEFFRKVFDQATPATAAESLGVIGEPAASRFDHWFTMHYGDRIPRRVQKMGSVPFRPGMSMPMSERVAEAFHRAVLNRREPW